MKVSFTSRGVAVRLAMSAAFATLVALPQLSAAGPRYGDPGVTIFTDSSGGGYAMGTLGGTRDSADLIQRLSCLVSRTETTSASGARTRTTSVTCSARDTTRRTVSCTSTSDAMANALSGTSNDSLLEFHFDAAGKCTDIVVYESTSLERKS
jgi:hypothetical protein